MATTVQCEFCGKTVLSSSLHRHQESSERCRVRQRAADLERAGWMRFPMNIVLSKTIATKLRGILGGQEPPSNTVGALVRTLEETLHAHRKAFNTWYVAPGWGKSARVCSEHWVPRVALQAALSLLEEPSMRERVRAVAEAESKFRAASSELRKAYDEAAALLKKEITVDGASIAVGSNVEALVTMTTLGGEGVL